MQNYKKRNKRNQTKIKPRALRHIGVVRRCDLRVLGTTPGGQHGKQRFKMKFIIKMQWFRVEPSSRGETLGFIARWSQIKRRRDNSAVGITDRHGICFRLPTRSVATTRGSTLTPIFHHDVCGQTLHPSAGATTTSAHSAHEPTASRRRTPHPTASATHIAPATATADPNTRHGPASHQPTRCHNIQAAQTPTPPQAPAVF